MDFITSIDIQYILYVQAKECTIPESFTGKDTLGRPGARWTNVLRKAAGSGWIWAI